jgi:hypothetical protein
MVFFTTKTPRHRESADRHGTMRRNKGTILMAPKAPEFLVSLFPVVSFVSGKSFFLIFLVPWCLGGSATTTGGRR